MPYLCLVPQATNLRTEIYGGYADLLGDSPLWTIGRFPLSGNREWLMREPEAVTIVRNGYLSIGVQKLTRFHDRAQILDNAKHVMFSTRRFPVPATGGISFEVSIKVRRRGATPGDLYDGYGSFLCLDLKTGTAMDWFVADDMAAAAYARLPFPGLSLPEIGDFNYWAIFDEVSPAPSVDGFNTFGLTIEPSTGISWSMEGAEVSRRPMPYRLGELTLGLAIMTEKDIGPSGSVSLHGQGIQAEWSPVRVQTWDA
jgi:hypothetical protein